MTISKGLATMLGSGFRFSLKAVCLINIIGNEIKVVVREIVQNNPIRSKPVSRLKSETTRRNVRIRTQLKISVITITLPEELRSGLDRYR